MAIRKMLVPVQPDEQDARVLAYACGLVEQGVRELLVVTVIEASGVEAPVLVAQAERARQRLLAMVEPYRDCGLTVELRVVTGDVFSALTGLAHQADIDVICCGTEGKSFVDYLLGGSLSEDLVTTGDERTMTIRYDLLNNTADPSALSRDFAKRLVVPVDFSASSMRAVLSAFERPASALGEVHFVHALAPRQSFESIEQFEQHRREIDVKMRGLEDLATEHDAKAVLEVREGNPLDVVYDYVYDICATGVITGRRGRGRIGREVLGSVSMKLLRDAPCPVVIQP